MVRLFSVLVLAGAIGVAALNLPDGARTAYAIDCSLFPYQQAAQFFLRADPSDVSGLDGDDDNGIACDDLPCPCDTEPVEEAIDTPDAGSAEPTSASTGTNASAGDSSASASASTQPAPTPTVTVGVSATADPSPTVPGVSSGAGRITPPSTGNAGLR